MVVLSAAICTNAGKALLSRQFVEMTRLRIEGLLAAFPKLMIHDSKQQHTFIETKDVRYVYQPLDGALYLLLITNRASNIVDDLDTLRLLSKVVPFVTGTTGNLTEKHIIDSAFQLIFAFDEALSAGGYHEAITLSQIRTNMEMESHEEKLQNMIKLSKIESARDKASQAAERLIRDRGSNMTGFGGGAPMQGMGSSSMGGGGFDSHTSSYDAPFSAGGSAASGAGGYGDSSGGYETSIASTPAAPVPPPRTGLGKGMSLGGEPKSDSFMNALIKEEKLAPIPVSSKPATAGEVAPIPVAPVVQQPLMLTVTERVSYSSKDDGKMDVKGSLSLVANVDEVANCTIKMSRPNGLFSFSTHPRVNKAAFEQQSILQLKDPSQAFPTGRPVGILKWERNGTSTLEPPVQVSCWADEVGNGLMSVTIDLSLSLSQGMELHNLAIKIPLGTSTAPQVGPAPGVIRHNAAQGELSWEFDLVDDSFSGATLEFTIPQSNPDAFTPTRAVFTTTKLFCGSEVLEVLSTTGAPIQYGFSKSLVVDQYLMM